MKKCRIFTTDNNSGYEKEGFPGDYERCFTQLLLTDDGFVLSAELCWRTMKWLSPDDPNRMIDMNDESAFEEEHPAKIIDGQKLYTPYCGTYISRERDNNRLKLPFEADGKWGYCYAYTGEVIIPPKWDFCDDFDGGFARFNIGGSFDPMNERIGNNKWGYIDEYGDEIIPPLYQYLSRPGFDGFILAKKDGAWGVVNQYGDTVIPFEWDGIWFDYENQWEDRYHTLHKGFVAMKDIGGRKQYTALNSNGKVMIEDLPNFAPPEYSKQYIFHDDEEDPDELF